MYPFIQSSSSVSNEGGRSSAVDSYFDRVVGRELAMGSTVRRTMKGSLGNKFQIKNAKGAAATQKMELTHLRKQIKALPELLKENMYNNYQFEMATKMKDLDDFQYVMIFRLGAIIKKQYIESGIGTHFFRIGGNDRRIYEKFYRVEPSASMTKPQFITAIRHIFGDDVMKVENRFNKLFDTFDKDKKGSIDWRGLLYLLTIVMQGDMGYEEHLRWAFSIYTSSGLLDLNSNGSLSFKTIKDFMCVPVYSSKRITVCNIIDEAWMKFSVIDYDCHKLTNKILNNINNIDDSIDKIMISYQLFSKFLMNSDICKYLETSPNGFTYVMEDMFFHPILLKKLKEARKVFRIDKQVDLFIESKFERIKKYTLMRWKRLIKTYVHFLHNI